jgi:hypothetical protein
MRWLEAMVFGRWTGLALVLALASCWFLFRNWRNQPVAIVLVSFSVLLAIAYPILGVPIYTWYLIPQVMAINLLLALWPGAVVKATARRSTRAIVVAGAAACLCLLPIGHAIERTAAGWAQYRTPERFSLYRDVGVWLRDNAPPYSSVLYVEVGIIGYFSGLEMVDPLGLVSPEAASFLERRDLAGYFAATRPDYVLRHPDLDWLMDEVLDHPSFDDYEQVTTIRGLDIYRRATLDNRPDLDGRPLQ